MQLAPLVAVEFHEHQVPDFHVAVAVLIGAAGRAAGHLLAVIIKYLTARPAGSGITHGPEVVFLATAAEAVFIDSYLFQPDGLGIGIIPVHAHPQSLFGDGQFYSKELPGILYGLLLEVITEAEIAQHLEESVVAGGVSHVIQVVMLAPGAHTALGGYRARAGALLMAEKHVLELHHAGVGEQQRRIIGRHQR